MAEEKSFGAEFREVREEAGWTLRGLASELDISPTYLSDIERGRRLPPGDELISKALSLMGIEKQAAIWRYVMEARIRWKFPELSDSAIRRMAKIAIEDAGGAE